MDTHDETDFEDCQIPPHPSDLEPFLPLPNHIDILDSPDTEAKFFAEAYKKAKTPEEKEKVVNGLFVAGGRWDIITRSLSMYPAFERYVGEEFPGLWR